MKQIIIVSRYPFSPHVHVEGIGYHNKHEAITMMKVFAERAKSIDSINIRYGLGETVGVKKVYEIAELNIPNDFLKD